MVKRWEDSTNKQPQTTVMQNSTQRKKPAPAQASIVLTTIWHVVYVANRGFRRGISVGPNPTPSTVDIVYNHFYQCRAHQQKCLQQLCQV